MAAPVLTLPTEIQSAIIRLLDPISLISIAQTNTHFRLLISPEKKHFAERLLELELLPEYGGPCPIFRARDNHLSPGPLDPDWKDIRWACTSCLRLLSHTHFDNHSILRLRYRKPSPPVPGASHAVTSWEPTTHGRSRRFAKRARGNALSDEKMQRLRYSICVSRGRGTAPRTEPPMSRSLSTLLASGMAGLDDLTQDEFDALTQQQKLRIFDENARSIERERCGTLRHRRQCNECRYQHGDLRPQLRGRGRRAKASTMPILPSRRTSTFGSYLDRWFPGFSHALENKRPAYNTYVYWIFMRWIYFRHEPDILHCVNMRERPLAVYTARCPGCGRWQELRHFRIAPPHDFPNWRPNVATGYRRNETTLEEWAEAEASLDQSRCNACFAAENGREELCRALWFWFDRVSFRQLGDLSNLMHGTIFAFNPFRHSTHVEYGRAPREYVRQMRALERHTPRTGGEVFSTWNNSYSGLATLRLRQAQWKDLWERTKRVHDTNWTTRDMDKWYDQWVRTFDEAEEHWLWLRRSRDEVQERPMALVEWALDEDHGQAVET